MSRQLKPPLQQRRRTPVRRLILHPNRGRRQFLSVHRCGGKEGATGKGLMTLRAECRGATTTRLGPARLPRRTVAGEVTELSCSKGSSGPRRHERPG